MAFVTQTNMSEHNRGGDKKLKSPQEQKDWAHLKEYILDNLANYRNLRLTDIVRYAFSSQSSLSSRTIRRLVSSEIPEYGENIHKQLYTFKRSHRMIQLPKALGYYQGDIVFLSALSLEAKRLNSKIDSGGALVLVDITSQYTYVIPLGHLGKSSKGLHKALSKFVELHKETHGHSVKEIVFDKERGFLSWQVQNYLAANHIKSRVISWSNVKAAKVEGKNKLIRQWLARILKNHPGKSWHQVVTTIANEMNQQKIVLKGKTLPFAPANFTSKNVSQYVRAMERVNPLLHFSRFPIDPDLVPFKYKVGEFVAIKLKAISQPGIGTKWSNVNIDQSRWIIKERFGTIGSANDVIPAYLLERFDGSNNSNPPETISMVERALFPVAFSNSERYLGSLGRASSNNNNIRTRSEREHSPSPAFSSDEEN